MRSVRRSATFFAPGVDVSPGVVGLSEWGSQFTRSLNRKMIAGKYLVRHLQSIQEAARSGAMSNVFWAPGAENPADAGSRGVSMEDGCTQFLLQIADTGCAAAMGRDLKMAGAHVTLR